MNKSKDYPYAHQYLDEFTEEMSVIEFGAWVGRNVVGFVNNISRSPMRPKPLHEWIAWFLAWTEYSDFMEWKKEREKDE